MSRPWRIEYEGALYHLLSRGNERNDIFIDDKDRSGFFEAVGNRQTIWVELFRDQPRCEIGKIQITERSTVADEIRSA